MVIGEDAKLDAERFYRTPSGVVLVTVEMLAKLKA
jgi:glucose-1-phosphate adenylyltransferase